MQSQTAYFWVSAAVIGEVHPAHISNVGFQKISIPFLSEIPKCSIRHDLQFPKSLTPPPQAGTKVGLDQLRSTQIISDH